MITTIIVKTQVVVWCCVVNVIRLNQIECERNVIVIIVTFCQIIVRYFNLIEELPPEKCPFM